MKKSTTIIITVVITIIVLFALLYWIGSKDKNSNAPSNEVNVSNSSTNSSTNKSVRFPNTFKSDELGFSVSYPADWEYTQPNAHTVVFSGKVDTGAYYSTVNVQSIASKKAGGKYGTTEELISSLKTQFLIAPQAKVVEEGNSTLTQADGMAYKGKYLIVTYLSADKELIKQQQKVFPTKNGLGFYTWAYTSPENQYDKYFPIAKSMLEQTQFAK